MMKTAQSMTAWFLFCLIPFFAHAENWPGFEKDNLHQNASSTTIDPAALTFKWVADFSNPVDCQTTNAGLFGSRDLCLVNGRIAIVARHNNTTGAGNRAYVTVLDTLDGSCVTCIRTAMGVGPRRDQFSGYGSMYMEAYDTGIGHTVSFWDPTTGIYYMANGGDGTDQTAYKILDNQDQFASAQASGDWYIWGVPAFEDIRLSYSGLQDDAGHTAADLTVLHSGFSDENWDLAYGLTDGAGSNQTAFFEVPLDGDYIIKPNGSSHTAACGYVVVNKITGLTARLKNGLSNIPIIEPPVYSPALNWSEWRTFNMYGGCMTTNAKVYFMGPADDSNANSELGNDGIFSSDQLRDQGIYIGCLPFTYSDNNPNDGYTGPGAEETAVYHSALWCYRYDSPNTPTDLNDAESYLEQDGFYRNKAWMLDNDTVWAAWKPTQAGNVQLIHCGPSSLNNTYDLGVGAGRRGQDIWPHISYANLGVGEEYVVYYAANAWYKAHTGASQWSGWDTDPIGSQPLGPAELAVFDADAGSLRWTYVLNAADQSGPYSSLPPNEATGYFDRSQMLVAGQYAYIAWIDVSGANLVLKVVGFDITAGTAPSTPPTPFTYDLGVVSSGAKKSCVTDLIAADGSLYALVTVSDVWDTCNHTFDSQYILALQDSGAPNHGALEFSAASYSVSENGGTVTITVNRTGGSDGAVSVDYATSDGTAAAGSDYTASAGTLTWNDGDSASKTFMVAITDDVLVEGDETFTVTLSNAGGGASLGSPNSATVTVIDDDGAALPVVTVTATDANAAEPGSDTGEFTVTRTGSTSAGLTVNITVGGTASEGTDYNTIGASVTIPVGQASAAITITPIDDLAQEGSETVILTLAAGTGYTSGSPNSATVTIADDDLQSKSHTSSGCFAGGRGSMSSSFSLVISGLVFLVMRAQKKERQFRSGT